MSGRVAPKRLAQVRARLGYSYWSLLNFSWEYQNLPAESLLARGFQAVDRALRQDSNSADAWMVRGSLLAIRYPRTYDGVRAAFERALAIDPQNAEAHHLFALELRYLGEDSAAIGEYHRALGIEPGKAVSLQGLGSVRFAARQYGAALAMGFSVEDVQNWPAVVEAVTVDDVRQAAAEYLRPETSVTGRLTREPVREGERS